MRKSLVALSTVALLALAACGNDDAVDPRADAGDQGGTITVLAAASLTDTFTELAETFEEENPGVEVELSFAGSSDLVSQIQGGAPADVFASADEANMEKLTTDDLVDGEPVLFATNTLVIVTPPDNPAGIQSYADLGRADVDVVLCAPQVPCGAASQRLGELAGFQVAPVSEEQSVTDVLGKVTSGEADAGLVYVTDATGAGDAVDTVEVPEAAEVVNRYPIAVTAESAQPEIAQAWIELVTGDTGREVLEAAGFGLP